MLGRGVGVEDELGPVGVDVDGAHPPRAPGDRLVGDETIEGRRRRVRSTHVFAGGAELVLDAYAAPEHFAETDAAAFRPVVRSLELG